VLVDLGFEDFRIFFIVHSDHVAFLALDQMPKNLAAVALSELLKVIPAYLCAPENRLELVSPHTIYVEIQVVLFFIEANRY